jgi:4-diphosphocytidyl-2-C-methyl-D-erythritol kinase
VNLFLRVVGARPDGFHEIETIMHGIDLGDDIEITLTQTGQIEVEMSMAEGVMGDPPQRQQNIAYKAAAMLIERGAKSEGLHIRIVKHIPVGAGLGGGSGNAAGIIVALNELWKMELGRPDMLDVAALVGSDVPYCIEGGTAMATARGEKLTPLPAPDDLWFVLGISYKWLLTREVYEEFDRIGAQEEASPSPMTLALGAGDLDEIASLLYNDLELPACKMRPELEAKKHALVRAGALGAGMSGSGPTMFGMARDEEHAREIASAVAGDFDAVRVTCSRAECIERLD